MQGARSRSAARRAETTGGRALVPVARGRQDNLPAALTGLVGRARDVAALTARLAEARLLTLTGVGGVGKSRLALEVARAVRDRSVTEVWLVELAGVVEPSDVSSAVAAAVGAHDSGGRPLVETLIGRLADRDVLLVLDNCEHLIDAAAELTLTLLHACPNVRAL
ncbi:MAG: AAA family ATPase, partial [Chloroflexota bacterium]